MDENQMAEITRKRLKLNSQEWAMIEQNSKFKCLFKNAIEASKYRLVAEVIDSRGCHTGHVIGQTHLRQLLRTKKLMFNKIETLTMVDLKLRQNVVPYNKFFLLTWIKETC